eukprot:1089838-Amphidinium_carterae.1
MAVHPSAYMSKAGSSWNSLACHHQCEGGGTGARAWRCECQFWTHWKLVKTPHPRLVDVATVVDSTFGLKLRIG